ncbi:MAG: bifunctional riboflavin kinase/FAD synthetase [Pseudomonadales bacterium]|jgi:riboflavin kinase / FMN adenylyltransferase|nr:bifunctional riboflavin kinase/FAD synthetase [Pseudomonadales bacterium]MDP4765473.1 bifunctional riboflavin kinase/FAD synthetase [Pseudomonadales bacterium]
MEIIRGIHNIKPRHRGCIVTIGNFDGVHLGHQAILRQVQARSEEIAAPAMLICFEPQPKEFFDLYNAPARLTRFREKVELLAEHGIDKVLCLKFDEQTRSMSAAAFIDLLATKLQVRAVFAGDDARFGNDRTGDFVMLQAAGEKYGFDVTNLYTLTVNEARVSSTRIRECLALGDFDLAEKLLGRPYSITGKVVYGRQLGRTLDAPTANIQLHRYRAPIDGVYAIEIQCLGGTYRGVANVGVRPTLNDATVKPILEVHIFDFAQNLYGQTVKVIFRKKIREEQKFSGLAALKEAIRADIEVARTYFAAKDQ